MAFLTKRQGELLALVAEFGSDSWGDAWTHWSSWNPREGTALEFRNFDRIANALVRKGLVDDTDGTLTLTESGRRLASPPPPPVKPPTKETP